MELAFDSFPANGCADLGIVLDAAQCRELAGWVRRVRPIETLFKSREEFEANPTWTRCNPGPGINLLEQVDTAFIEDNETFKAHMTRLAGADYSIIDRKVVRSISWDYLPDWVSDIMTDCGQANVNPFIRPEYQDVTHFSAADWHQDHYRSQPVSNFTTVYIYLEDVGVDDSPLRLLPGSHMLGCTPCPHNLRPSAKERGTWYYWNDQGTVLTCHDTMVEGQAGSIAIFHAMTLHGTKPNRAVQPRVSLRYLVALGESGGPGSLLAEANARIPGDLSVAKARRLDIMPDGSYRPMGNALHMGSEV
jgi:hypothetical protein